MDQKDLKQIGELLDSKLDSKFADYDKKMDSKFAAYDKKMDSKFADYDKKMDKKFASRDRRLDRLEVNLISVIDERVDSRINKLEQKMFDWKSEIIDAVDSMAKEIRDEREFRDISSHQITDNSSRIDKLEKRVFSE